MRDGFPWLPALAAGLAINLVDVACTLLFAVKPWEAELRRQGLAPSKGTPPYYVVTNFVGGLVMSFLYVQMVRAGWPAAPSTALAAALLVWLVSRAYGGGHVVMGQMPLRIFATMSAGLGLGYALGGQVLRLLLAG